ncbi:MAG: LysR family transcriptional regulator substrate-binding protein, partial [Verrucomicrobiota bacterium]
TPAGQELYEFIKPFFDNLHPMADKLRGGVAQAIRIGASEIVLRDHLPALIEKIRERFPRLRFSLREAYQPQLEAWLEQQEIDLAVTLLHQKPSKGIDSLALLKMPLILLVAKNNGLKSAAELWNRDRIDEPLISLPANETICKSFQSDLAKRKVDWFPSCDVNSLNLIETYVANGYGIGLSIQIPNKKLPSGIRALPLPGFEPVTLGVLWRGKPSPLTQAFLDELKLRARMFMT